MSRRYVRTVNVDASPGEVFPRLDDQTRLAGHMEKPSAMMGGGRMTYTFDEARGQAVGSHIRMGGSAFGLSLMVDEVVTELEPPRRKAWRTTGPTRLIILEAYAMGFEIEPAGQRSRLTVWINYERSRGPGAILGLLLAPLYARWCVGRMADDAVRHFARAHEPRPPIIA